MAELLIKGAEAIAKAIGENRDSIQTLVEAGELKAWKKGAGRGTWLALPEDLADYVRQQRDKHVKCVEQ